MRGVLDLKAKKRIFILSDATGLTAEMAVNATLSQFRNVETEIIRITMVRDKNRLVEIIRSASETSGIIVYTLVSGELRRFFHSEVAKQKVQAVDLLGSMLNAFAEFLGVLPTESPGLQRELSESYFLAIEAIEYTVNHDDGQDPDGLNLADIVIAGVSRTSKTPLSIFLSNQYSLRVANIPIILEVEPPPQLFTLDKKRVIGLTISPERLMEIRRARIERAGFRAPPKYATYNNIIRELEYSNRLFATKGWTVIDVTEKSIEEITSEVLRYMRKSQSRTFI